MELIDDLIGIDPEKIPHRTVTSAEFRRAARKAGWQEKSIDLFLLPSPGKKAVKVGYERAAEMLTVRN